MADNQSNASQSTCVDTCDEKFISCVESLRPDCLMRFRDCSSECRFQND